MAQPVTAGPAQSATCARCGFCCRAIGVRFAPHDVLRQVLAHVAAGVAPGDWLFFLEHWHPLGRQQAAAINPRLREGLRQRDHFYTCDQFDAVTNLCRAHERRPETCRGFPWYGRPPNATALGSHPHCSYWADVPQADWPAGVGNLVQASNCG